MKNFLFLVSFILIILSFFITFVKLKSASVQVSAIVPGICGNGIKENNEQCDRNDFGGQTCLNYGYTGGNLICNSNCTLNFSNCISGPPPSGGGGVRGVPPPPSYYGRVIISGYAYSRSEVTLMSDGEIKAVTIADNNAKFEFDLNNLSPGNYLFTLYSEDNQGRRSSLYTFPVKISVGDTIRAGNILISPTIGIDKLEVKRGDFISIFGFSTPRSEVLINVSSDEELFLRTTSDNSGFYLYQLGTDVLEIGEHFTKSKTILANQMISNYSRVVSFKVGQKNLSKEAKKCPPVDLNNDCRVNLIDSSILAYWYKRPKPLAKVDLNQDGKVDLIDFSILAYWWTG